MATPDWSPKSPSWTNETVCLLNVDVSECPKQSVQNIMETSKKFPMKFPVDTGRCETLNNYITTDILERNINSVYPIVHENVLELYCKFILFKRKYGSNLEKTLYQNMTVNDFVNRLLQKRAVQFTDPFDYYTLLNGMVGVGNWEDVGTSQEQFPLILQDCLSYDEMKCSVFLSVSSYTYFVNIGNRSNMAKYELDRSKVEEEGIIIGLIGPRLHKSDVMECQDITITDEQNTEENGYGTSVPSILNRVFSDFYHETYHTYKEASKRIKADDKRYLGPKLSNVSDICFAYIDHKECGEYKNGDIFPVSNHPLSGIKIHIYNREPHSKLDDSDKGKLLVVSYAWDGNALPGNEYWTGQIGNSSDSAAASSTQITELHNPHINPLVSANTLMIVTSDSVVPFKEYQELIRSKRKRSGSSLNE